MELQRLAFRAMGCPCELQLYAPDAMTGAAAGQAAVDDILRIEQRYSRYRDDSLTSAINRVAAQAGAMEVDDETAALLDYAAACHRESAGLFDITSGVLRRAWRYASDTLPTAAEIDALLRRVGWHRVVWERPRLRFTTPGMELDFGGIGKEYAADRAAVICLDAGIRHGLVNLGGDVRLIGPHPDGSPWRVGIQDPRRPERLIGGLLLTGGALASSGDYARGLWIDGRRYGHILDPRSGWPVAGLAAVSVLADSCLVAGSACTIAMLKGWDGKAWLQGLGLSHLWIDIEGRRGGRGALAEMLTAAS